MPWLDKVSKPVEQWVSQFYGQPGEDRYKVKDALNGVWLGHVLHPALVDIPLGAWSATTMFDLAWLGNPSEANAKGADATLWLGLVGAIGSAVTGLTNWVDTDGPEKRTGMLHGLLNGGITVLNLASALLRASGQRRSAITLSTTAFAVSLYSAYLGGDLSYASGVNVNHVAWYGGPDDFVAVMDVADLPEGKPKRVDAAGIPAVLVKDGGNIQAIAAICSHMGGPLDEGSYADGVIHCPWHNSGFFMCDGSIANSPAVYAQPTFEVRTRNGKIELRRLEHA
jgi:nitrite reductase/ring-hydroxylating ferredoxin subunit/uncharacterized membrane protein